MCLCQRSLWEKSSNAKQAKLVSHFGEAVEDSASHFILICNTSAAPAAVCVAKLFCDLSHVASCECTFIPYFPKGPKQTAKRYVNLKRLKAFIFCMTFFYKPSFAYLILYISINPRD